jgi:riboflavin biosynthesis pyrimidine reductase
MSLLDPPLELLHEPAGLPEFELPDELAAAYPGTIGFPGRSTFANFVQTVDGVTAIPSVPQSNRLIAGGSPADRLLMGLLRACAGAVVIGSGTLEGSPGGSWSPERAFPAAAAAFAELRARLGLAARIGLVVLTARGSVDPAHPALEEGALVLTTDGAAARLRAALPAAAEVVSLGLALDPAAAFALLRQRGFERILSEGGPHALGAEFAAGLVDELFLTVSPLLVGRPHGDGRLSLDDGADLLTSGPLAARLIGVRRDRAHLFLRYAFA